jgi:kynurenine formamidase
MPGSDAAEAAAAAAGQDTIFSLGDSVRTWGTWGEQDERGSQNFITPQQWVAAARLVRRGVVFSLSLPIQDGKGPARPYPVGRFNPIHRMTVTGHMRGPLDMGATTGFTDDVLVMGLQTSTHWDALCHIYYQDHMYNGYPATDVDSTGAHRNGIDKVHADFFGRGVLLDVARSKEVDVLPAGYAISAEDLVECMQREAVEVGQGDMLLIRTGAMSAVRDGDWTDFYARPRAGLHYTVASWLGEKRIAAVAADNHGIECPSDLPGVRNPFHMLALRDMGISLGEFWSLDELAADCAADGVYEFLLTAPPLRVEGGAGSPVNPLAVK